MRILFVMGDPHLPQFTGGAQSSSHELAIEFIRQGHRVGILCKLVPGGIVGLQNRLRRRLSGHNAVADKILGYPVFRQWDVRQSVADVVKAFNPDVALVQIGQQIVLARELVGLGVPTLVYIRTAEMVDLRGDPKTVPGVRFIANSKFTARRFQAVFGTEAAAIPPFFIAGRYRVRRRGQHVTFVNPHPLKGLDIAAEVARRCPDIKFLFVESWPLGKKDRSEIRKRLRGVSNVKYRARTSNMKGVYAQTKIVLMPSRWEEAWGRVASEAQFSGIPVVASNRGGLPESVGPGGILLDPDGPIEAWVEAVRCLWSDGSYYEQVSAAALAYTRRREIEPSFQVNSLLDLMETTIAATREGAIAAKKIVPANRTPALGSALMALLLLATGVGHLPHHGGAMSTTHNMMLDVTRRSHDAPVRSPARQQRSRSRTPRRHLAATG